MSNADIILGLDIGSKRIGVARGSTVARLATPLAIIPVDGQEIQALKLLAHTEKASRLVVGLPRNLELKDTAQTKLVRQYTEENISQTGLPIFWQDEAASSVEAQQRIQPGSKFKHDDAHAAAIILQDYLDTL